MRRLVAFCIDMLTIIILNTLVGTILLFFTRFFLSVESEEFEIIAITGMSTLVMIYIIYFSLGESSICKYTLGGKLTKIKTVNLNGSSLSFSKSIVRTIVKCISIFAFLGYLLILFSPRKQALHDYALGTVVIRYK